MADQQEQYPDAQIGEPNGPIELDPHVHEMQGLFITIDWTWGFLPFVTSMFEWYLSDILEDWNFLMNELLDFWDWLVEDMRADMSFYVFIALASGVFMGLCFTGLAWK